MRCLMRCRRRSRREPGRYGVQRCVMAQPALSGLEPERGRVFLVCVNVRSGRVRARRACVV